jgi:UDP-4-amino-4,6-dideoxy-N-acetyl-beta-L-altrosamine transaminase
MNDDSASRPFLPYGRQSIDDADIDAVISVLRSDWLTTGPAVDAFEGQFAQFVGARHAVAVSSGTAALHALMHGLGVGPGDEVIVPAMTFAATANAVVFQGGTPVFADVLAGNLLIDPESVARLMTPRTKAIIAVDYAGQPCDYDSLRGLTAAREIALVADGCHALGADFRGRRVGAVADATAFSFHPVKHVTTGEGGMITTDDGALAQRMRIFRNHGITTDHRQRSESGQWRYEMVTLGYNYRITDFQCALGSSQLKKLPLWLDRRRAIARQYDEAFASSPRVRPVRAGCDVNHAYHLYVVRIENRDRAYAVLRRRGIGVNVHYIPVHLHRFYRDRFGTHPGLCPVAEAAYAEILSLPMYPGLTDEDLRRVIQETASLAE